MLVGMVGLLAAGLAGFSVGVNSLLHKYLVDRMDQQLTSLAGTVRLAIKTDDPGASRRVDALLPAGAAAELRDARGGVLGRWMPASGAGGARRAALAVSLPASAPDGLSEFGKGGVSYRLRSDLVPAGGEPDRLLVALPLTSVNGTISRLTELEILLGFAIAGIGAGLTLALARLATRPLRRIAETADAIAAGDVSRRVPDAGRRTEARRVGLAFNTMLGEIQTAMSRLAESEQRMRRFLADAAHELSTPLTSIRGYAELFRHGARDRPADLDLVMDRIEREGARMSNLVEELLLLASVNEGRPLLRDRVDLAEIAAEVVDDARARAPDRRIELHASRPAWVLGDRGRLRQVAANLTGNACQHTPAGTPVCVRVRAVDDRSVLEVGDEGPGLNAEQAARVFDRFYRTDGARSRGSGGTGLGLAIVAAITASHGGRVSVRTVPDQGAIFLVELPAAPGCDAPPSRR